jgi:hypothetical protein
MKKRDKNMNITKGGRLKLKSGAAEDAGRIRTGRG